MTGELIGCIVHVTFIAEIGNGDEMEDNDRLIESTLVVMA